MADVLLVQKQRFVGPDRVLGQTVAKFALGEPHVAAKIFIDVVRERQIRFAGIVESDKKVAGVDDVAQFVVNFLVQFI